jgi:hypothetical protein
MPISRVKRRRPRPQAVDERASVRGLRVAIFEALKDVIVLLLGLGILSLLHKDVEAAAEIVGCRMHLSNAATHMTDAGLWVIFQPRLSTLVCGSRRRGGYGTGVCGQNGSHCCPAPYICRGRSLS